jgi:hypothetical protein
MSIVRNSISAVSLALLTVGCDADSTPPSAPRDTPQSIRAAPASATHDRFRLREVGAQTLFASVDPSGCIETDVVIVGAEQTLKEGGKPTEQPLALVQVFVFDFCSGAVLRNLFGITNDADVVGDRQLNQATVQGTIPVTDDITGATEEVEVDVVFTGFGGLTVASDRFHLRQPGFFLNVQFRGTFRAAEVSGSVVLGGENLIAGPPVFAELFRTRQGEMAVTRTPRDSV